VESLIIMLDFFSQFRFLSLYMDGFEHEFSIFARLRSQIDQAAHSHTHFLGTQLTYVKTMAFGSSNLNYL
jgi:hypothetical protein